MKRFVFWVFLIVAAVGWIRASHHRGREFDDARRAAARSVRDRADVRTLGPDGRPTGPARRDDRGWREDDLREPAEGLPVPVVPGSRTTEAWADTPTPRGRGGSPGPQALDRREAGGPSDELTVVGLRSATEERARKSAREALDARVATWMAPEVPASWKVPPRLVDRMTREVVVRPIERDYGTVYEATITADVSADRRARVLAAYRREQVMSRIATLAVALGFVLFCLAALEGYIRADEATRGRYTNRLRLASAVGLGAAGLALYRYWHA